jgi:hypothetical protein
MIFHRDPVYQLESIIGQRGEFEVAAWLEMETHLYFALSWMPPYANWPIIANKFALDSNTERTLLQFADFSQSSFYFSPARRNNGRYVGC